MAYNQLFLIFRCKTALKNQHFQLFFGLRHGLIPGTEHIAPHLTDNRS
jgi:hypothetical protein